MTRVRVESKSCDQGRCKNDDFILLGNAADNFSKTVDPNSSKLADIITLAQSLVVSLMTLYRVTDYTLK